MHIWTFLKRPFSSCWLSSENFLCCCWTNTASKYGWGLFTEASHKNESLDSLSRKLRDGFKKAFKNLIFFNWMVCLLLPNCLMTQSVAQFCQSVHFHTLSFIFLFFLRQQNGGTKKVIILRSIQNGKFEVFALIRRLCSFISNFFRFFCFKQNGSSVAHHLLVFQCQ